MFCFVLFCFVLLFGSYVIFFWKTCHTKNVGKKMLKVEVVQAHLKSQEQYSVVNSDASLKMRAFLSYCNVSESEPA